jgi:hypothetical protein
MKINSLLQALLLFVLFTVFAKAGSPSTCKVTNGIVVMAGVQIGTFNIICQNNAILIVTVKINAGINVKGLHLWIGTTSIPLNSQGNPDKEDCPFNLIPLLGQTTLTVNVDLNAEYWVPSTARQRPRPNEGRHSIPPRGGAERG